MHEIKHELFPRNILPSACQVRMVMWAEGMQSQERFFEWLRNRARENKKWARMKEIDAHWAKMMRRQGWKRFSQDAYLHYTQSYRDMVDDLNEI
mgnify:CR=1 FL=1